MKSDTSRDHRAGACRQAVCNERISQVAIRCVQTRVPGEGEPQPGTPPRFGEPILSQHRLRGLTAFRRYALLLTKHLLLIFSHLHVINHAGERTTREAQESMMETVVPQACPLGSADPRGEAHPSLFFSSRSRPGWLRRSHISVWAG